ncbi:MAG: Ig-like domain-containing protein, partial [Oscillospiraceae bacterium]|nr:Ig-like domain-containing protein [Oscillospiraceae bacterium]
MKRLLSILLAIMMVATLLPAGQVFATEGEANQGITIRYDFSAFMAERAYRWNESGPWLTNINYESTNGLYKYASSSIEQKEDDGSAVSGNNYYGGSNRHNPYLTVSAVAADDYYFQLGNNYRLSFEIYVPVTGKYKMNVGYADCKDYDGVMSVYMNQGEKPEHAWNYKISQYVCEKRGADRRYKLSTTLKKWDTKEDALLDTDLEIELTKGYHFITFKSSNYGYIKYLELVSGDGSGKAPVYAKSSIDANLLNLDGQKNAKMSVHGVYLSTGEAANGDEYSVSFRSTDEAVAIVDNDGNITAKGVGEADIIADVMIGGASFETKQHVSVEEKGVKIIYNLAADMATLGMNWGVDQTTYPLSLISYENTKNFYALHESSRVYEGDFIKYSGGIQLQYKGNNMSNPAEYVTFEINVPAAGTYDVDILTTLSNNTSLNTRPKVFFSSKGKSQADEDYVGDYNVYVENVPQGAQKLHVGKVVVDKPGKYYITFSLINDPGWRYTKISTFTLTSGTNNALMNGNITSTSDTINVDNGENATVSATGFISSTAEAATFTYSSSNTDIATVDAETGLVTPLKEGKVTITATANGAEVANTLTTDITVTVNKPGEAIADTMVNVGIEAMPGGTVQTNLTEVVSEVEIGTKVSATATAADGYEFAYWADATGKVLSTKAEETFTINVNTSVKAYFEKIPAADAET